MNLSSKLWSLSKLAIEKADEYNKSGEMIVQKRPYIKSKVTSFDYKQGNIGYGKSFQEIVKDEWETKNHYDFIEHTVKPLKKYKEIVGYISKTYKVEEPQADFWLSRFIQLITNPFQGVSSDEILVDKVSNFICDLNKGPFSWESKIWINGIWLGEDSYQLSDDLKIRRPKESDLEDESPIDLLIIRMPGLEPSETASAIIELNYRTDKQHELSEEIDATIGCLKLFGTGSIYRVKSTSSSESVLTFGGTQFSHSLKPTHYKYELKKTDIKKLSKIIDLIKPKLIKLSKEPLNPLNIAFNRYEDAILGQGIIESRVTSAITCLEALFLKPEERAELSGRLSQRVGMLLNIEERKPLEVQRELLRAYEIRSTFIHGSTLAQDEQQKNQELADKIVEYARLSLLVFVILEETLNKVSLINKIDNSLLDLKAREDLLNTLNNEYKQKVS